MSIYFLFNNCFIFGKKKHEQNPEDPEAANLEIKE